MLTSAIHTCEVPCPPWACWLGRADRPTQPLWLGSRLKPSYAVCGRIPCTWSIQCFAAACQCQLAGIIRNLYSCAPPTHIWLFVPHCAGGLKVLHWLPVCAICVRDSAASAPVGVGANCKSIVLALLLDCLLLFSPLLLSSCHSNRATVAKGVNSVPVVSLNFAPASSTLNCASCEADCMSYDLKCFPPLWEHACNVQTSGTSSC